MSPDHLAAARVPNQGAACTTAAVLTALAGLGAHDLPPLGAATLALGAAQAYGPPALLDYVALPWRRALLDERIEALATRHGLRARSRSGLVVPGLPLRPDPGEVIVANLAWGQEAPGRWGTWGWHPLRPSTYSTGGHSVVLAAVEPNGGWLVVDPNHPGVQRWGRPALAVTVTRISAAGAQGGQIEGLGDSP
jgi:hypothetical protein